MTYDDYIIFGNGYTSVRIPNFGEEMVPRIPLSKYAREKGERNADKYKEKQLLEMLKSRNYEDIYQAFGAIGKRKLKIALPYLKNIALYDEDQGLQEEAIITIRQIGGKKAHDILRFLKTTEHKEFIEEILNKDPG